MSGNISEKTIKVVDLKTETVEIKIAYDVPEKDKKVGEVIVVYPGQTKSNIPVVGKGLKVIGLGLADDSSGLSELAEALIEGGVMSEDAPIGCSVKFQIEGNTYYIRVRQFEIRTLPVILGTIDSHNTHSKIVKSKIVQA